ncbi:MAG TPA: hypothetical protein VHG28_24470 [Longimicrobiaceae bacterium]|nr:hypothetical protein [Longimicrobiaceae bacterium]
MSATHAYAIPTTRRESASVVVSRTPLRISFFGGGTDFREFYLREGGCVLSTTIDKFVHVTVRSRVDGRIRVQHTRTELVEHVDELRHDLIRESLRRAGITGGVEVATSGDVPATGSGLGSSSAVIIGLLNGLYTLLGTPADPEMLARHACEVEVDVLGRPIGVQDQYIASYGGQCFLRFNVDGRIDVEPLGLTPEQRLRFGRNLMLFSTRLEREGEAILREQARNAVAGCSALRELKHLAEEARGHLLAERFDDFGRLLHWGWEFKKRLASRISNATIDRIYEAARSAGAFGGKVCGAGGGGYLLLYCPPERQDRVREALRLLPEFPFGLEAEGTRVIHQA